MSQKLIRKLWFDRNVRNVVFYEKFAITLYFLQTFRRIREISQMIPYIFDNNFVLRQYDNNILYMLRNIEKQREGKVMS